MTNNEVFEGMESKRTFIFNFIERELEISRARKEGLNNLALAEHSVGESYGEKQRISYMLSMCKYLAEERIGNIAKRQILQRATTYTKL